MSIFEIAVAAIPALEVGGALAAVVSAVVAIADLRHSMERDQPNRHDVVQLLRDKGVFTSARDLLGRSRTSPWHIASEAGVCTAIELVSELSRANHSIKSQTAWTNLLSESEWETTREFLDVVRPAFLLLRHPGLPLAVSRYRLANCRRRQAARLYRAFGLSPPTHRWRVE